MNDSAKCPAFDFSKFAELGDGVIPILNSAHNYPPISWSERNNGWVVCGHAEVTEGLRGNFPLSAGRHKGIEANVLEARRSELIPNILKYFPMFSVNMDPPSHARVRKLLLTAFTKKVVENFRPTARKIIEVNLDSLNDRTEIEFVGECARAITARNLLEIVGLADHATYLPKLERWSHLMVAGTGAIIGGYADEALTRETDAVFAEQAAIFQREIDARRKSPGDDLVSQLVTASEDGDSLTDDEIIANLILIIIAGHDTTLNTMALSVLELSRNAGARKHIIENPDNILNATMELMRFISMSTHQFRFVQEDFDWNGNILKKGQMVHLMIGAANRDPALFTHPEMLDLTRPQYQNLTFGPGLHHCIGHLFAKMQLTEFFPQFLRRFESFDVIGDVPFSGGVSFRGPTSMHLRLMKSG
jgi:cytochrome P450